MPKAEPTLPDLDLIVSMDERAGNDGKRADGKVTLTYLGGAWKTVLGLRSMSVSQETARELIGTGKFLDIGSDQDWGIDVINPDHFQAAHLAEETDEYYDQNVLTPNFKAAAVFGIPYREEDPDLTQRFAGWQPGQTSEGKPVLINPRYAKGWESHI